MKRRVGKPMEFFTFFMKERYKVINSKIEEKLFLNKGEQYLKNYEENEAKAIFIKGLKYFPNSYRLNSTLADIALKEKDWESAAKRWGQICGVYKQKASLDVHLYNLMVNGIIGNKEAFSNGLKFVLKNYSEDIKKDKDGYRKIILFDNGESRIEYYKKLRETNTVIITFDSINIGWNDPPFSFKLLNKEDVDIIAVRRRQKTTYQQDLSREDFYKVLSSLVENYDRRVAYGYSLGGYTSLYFASVFECEILSISPRNSAHPKHGKLNKKEKFNHLIYHPKNTKISPIIVFDPKDEIDKKYVEELKDSYPQARFIEIPYGGHGMTLHLLRMGLLKEFILTVLHNKGLPKYNKKLRVESNIYYCELGEACLKRNKPRWALDLSRSALKLQSKDNLSMRLKIKALRDLKKYDSAIKFAEESIEVVPKDIIIRELLIDLYLVMGNIGQADETTNKAISDIGKARRLLVKKKEVDSWKKSLND